MERYEDRFPLLSKGFHPYLAKVFLRIPKKVKNLVIEDTSLQIVGGSPVDRGNFGLHSTSILTFEFPVKHIIKLNYMLLRWRGELIVYEIAYSLAQWVKLSSKISYGKSLSAEKLLAKWGFESVIEPMFTTSSPMITNPYLLIGEQWAAKQDEKYLLDEFGKYFEIFYRCQYETEAYDELNSLVASILSINKDNMHEYWDGCVAAIEGIMKHIRTIKLKNCNSIYFDVEKEAIEIIIEKVSSELFSAMSFGDIPIFAGISKRDIISELYRKVARLESKLSDYKRTTERFLLC